jgi:GT2 family glycosyltransferase/glycosyltransferase involved in cell wall biosynthesis
MAVTDASHPARQPPSDYAGASEEQPQTAPDSYGQILSRLRIEERATERYSRSHRQLAQEARYAMEDAQMWQDRYLQLEQSAAVRAMNRFRALIERLAPQGTTRRQAYSRGVVMARRLARRTRLTTAPGGSAAATVPTIPMALQPDVSIVIPVHNQWEVTAACLRSIATDFSAVGFEVIVVDDASDDETPEALDGVVGVNVVRLQENQGFIAAVNAGIATARGRFIVLLNNDTICYPGWLDALVRTAESDETIGVVGAKLVYPDGRLQEAGGIIWQDATGHNYGRNQSPDDPAYNFVRDVDYCSGACLLVRRELLAAVGGLDTRFAPAYYEDTDLCFAAREHGYRVVYQPASVVCHLEGASNGTDVTTGIKQYQVVNQQTFRTKWADALSRQGVPAPDRPRLTSWRTPAGRALVIDHQIPMPDHDSGSHRMFELLQLLKDLGFGVTFVPQNSIVIPRYQEALAALGVEVLGGPGELDPYIEQVGSALKVVIFSRPTVAWANYPMIRTLVPDAPIVYDTVDLHYLRERGRAAVEESLAAKKSADFHYDMELTLARLCDQTWTVTQEEKDALLVEEPDLQVAVIPNVHQEEPPGLPFEQRQGLLFIGNYSHPPNRDAARWLVEEILPLVRVHIPDMRLHLVGSSPTPEITALAGDGVIVDGWVPSVDELYRRVRLAVVPLRFGAGMKGKVGESLAYGVPVVTTVIGAQGMELRHGQEALIAEDAAELAKAIVEAYGNRELWTRLAKNGSELISATSSPGSVRQTLKQTLADLGATVPT